LKLPQFWPADLQIWLAQVESQFATRKITDQDTKFHYVITSLLPEVAGEIRDLLIQKPTNDVYDKLKEKLMKRTTASLSKKLQQLSMEDLGDRKPSQLLRKFQQLLDDTSSDHPFVRELFLQRLPTHVRQLITITTTDTTSLEEVAQIADKVMEVLVQRINSILPSQETNEVQALRAELTEVNKT
jgi:hypothetical protein